MTVKELMLTKIVMDEVGTVAVVKNGQFVRVGSPLGAIDKMGGEVVKDYSVEYDADFGEVYLEIEVA